MDLAQTMAEETRLGFHLKFLQQQEQTVLNVFPSTNQRNLTLQAILQRLHAAQVRGLTPHGPWDVHNIMNCRSAAQPVQLKNIASYDSAFDASCPCLDLCQPRLLTAPCCCRLPDAD